MPYANGLALYVHVPFCRQKCLYCDFYSLPLIGSSMKREINLALKDYPAAVLQELDTYLNYLKRFREKNLPQLSSLFLGGGTPTCLPLEQLEVLIRGCLTKFQALNRPRRMSDTEIEITVEANPETLDATYLARLKACGVNRLSLGLQSLDDVLLGRLGRRHRAIEALRVYKQARQQGFKNINVDLIYGLPGQTLNHWQTTLKEVLSLAPEHVSAYALKIEPGTPFDALWKQGKLTLPEEDEEVGMFEALREKLHLAGYQHYELSNFAHPGYTAKHNLAYWKNREYLGLGPSAHSCLRGVLPSEVWKARLKPYQTLPVELPTKQLVRFANKADLTSYLRDLASGNPPVAFAEVISPELERAETMFLGLRLRRGVSEAAFKKRFGLSFNQAYPGVKERLKQRGLLHEEAGHLSLTSRALFIANEVFSEFLP